MNECRVSSLHHVALQTSDLDAALNFYVKCLGLELVKKLKFKKREMAWLRSGGLLLELFGVREGEALHPWSDFQPGPVHLAFLVKDLDSFLSHAATVGVGLHPSHPTPFVPPVAGAGRIAYLLGPDGEEVEIRTE